jgi:hypothetical protein
MKKKLRILTRSSQKPFLVKSAGGAASQLQALKTAIYISKSINRPFKIRHYPSSTGGYFPFAIQGLLYEGEIENLRRETRGLDSNHDTSPGMIIENHPLLRKGVNYEKLLKLIRFLGIDSRLRQIRGELSLEYSREKLDGARKRVKSVTGGYFPFVDELTDRNLDLRFKKSGIPNPYEAIKGFEISKRIVIHYRIGEKRTTFSHPGLMGDGILDPMSIKNLLESLPSVETSGAEVIVVSDEPNVALGLLKSVGINATLPDIKGDLWADMKVMSSANVLICPWSTVSQFVAALLVQKGRKVFYPLATSRGFNPDWSLPGANRYAARYLSSDHPIYDPNFSLEPGAHRIYGLPKNS